MAQCGGNILTLLLRIGYYVLCMSIVRTVPWWTPKSSDFKGLRLVGLWNEVAIGCLTTASSSQWRPLWLVGYRCGEVVLLSLLIFRPVRHNIFMRREWALVGSSLGHLLSFKIKDLRAEVKRRRSVAQTGFVSSNHR